MWQERISIIVKFAAIVGATGADATQNAGYPASVRKLMRPLPTLDHAAIGNLFYKSDLKRLRVPREHKFITDISIGTPPQPFKCLIDSGSADFWIPSRRCKDCSTTNSFHADASSSFMPAVENTPNGLMPVPVRMSYSRYQGQGHGEVMGFLVQDTVRFGTSTVANQSFLIVEEATLPQHRSWDGICGLGWKQMSPTKSGQPLYRNFKPMHRNMEENDAAVVAFIPGSPHLPEGQEGPYIVTGHVPFAACKEGTLVWLPAENIDAKGVKSDLSFWAGSATWYVDRPNEWIPIETPMRFLIDTASPFILAPRGIFFRIARELFPAGVFDSHCGLDQWADNQVICLCEVQSQMHPLRLRYADHSFDITPEMLFKKAPAKNGGELCLFMMQENPMTSYDPLELLGDLLGGRNGLARRIPVEAPFKIPASFFFVPMANGMTGVEEEKVQKMADGSVCTSHLLYYNGTLKKNETTCTVPHGVPGRRLDVVPVQEPDAEPGNTWVFGGPFLEHFVIILDYEHSRLGFAEVAKNGDGIKTERVPQDQPLGSEYRHDIAARQSAEQGQQNAPWTAFALISIVVALGGGTAAHLARKLRQRKNFLTPIDGEEQGIHMEEDAEPDPFAAE